MALTAGIHYISSDVSKSFQLHPPRSSRLRRVRRTLSHDILKERQVSLGIGDLTLTFPEVALPTGNPDTSEMPPHTTTADNVPPSLNPPLPSPTAEIPGDPVTIPEGTSTGGTTASTSIPPAPPPSPSPSTTPSSPTSSSSRSPPTSFPASSASTSPSPTISTVVVTSTTEKTSISVSLSVSVSTTTERDTLTTSTYITTSGSKVWTATTTQTLAAATAEANGPNKSSGFASNTGAIVGVSIGSGFLLLLVAIILFLFCTRRRRQQEEERAIRTMEQRSHSTAHLRSEVDEDDPPPPSAHPIHLGPTIGLRQGYVPSGRQSRGEENPWLGRVPSQGGYGEDPYYGTAYSHAEQSSSSLSHPSATHQVSNASHTPAVPGFSGYAVDPYPSPLPNLRRGSSDEPAWRSPSPGGAGPLSEDDHRVAGSSSSHSHVQFAPLPSSELLRRESQLQQVQSDETGVKQKKPSLLKRLRGGAPTHSPSYSSASEYSSSGPPSSFLTRKGSQARSYSTTPELLHRNASTRTGYTTTEESAPPLTPPASEALFSYYNVAPPPSSQKSTNNLPQQKSGRLSSLLDPERAGSVPIIQTVPPVGPTATHNRGRSLTLKALPAFTYTAPPSDEEIHVVDSRSPWMQDLGAPSPAISVHRDGLVDKDVGKQRLHRMTLAQQIQAESQLSLDPEQRDSDSLRDYVDYSRPVLLRDAARMYTSSTMATEEVHPWSADVVHPNEPPLTANAP